MFTCVWAHICTWSCSCRSQIECSSLHIFHLIYWGHISCSNVELASSASWAILYTIGMPLFHLLNAVTTGGPPCSPSIYLGAGHPNSDPQAYMKSALPNKPPHPVLRFQCLVFSDLPSSSGQKYDFKETITHVTRLFWKSSQESCDYPMCLRGRQVCVT